MISSTFSTYAPLVGQGALALLVAAIGFFARRKAAEIHVLVNRRLDEALARTAALEQKLGLSSGEAIPAPQIVAQKSAPVDPTADAVKPDTKETP